MHFRLLVFSIYDGFIGGKPIEEEEHLYCLWAELSKCSYPGRERGRDEGREEKQLVWRNNLKVLTKNYPLQIV